MNRMIVAFILSTLMLSGCKKNMEYKPQDFFEGEQLEIAQLIFDGNEVKLKEKLPFINMEEINRQSKEKMTLLFWSLINSTSEKETPERLLIITDLVKAGADPLQPQQNMPGSAAESMMQADKGIWIEAILNGGLSPNARDKINNQPIIFKSFKASNTETLKVLIKNGADLNIKGLMGRTPLINALYNSDIEHIKVLLSNGADPSIKDDFNDSFTTLLDKEIKEKDNNNPYIQELIKIRVTIH